MKICPNCKSRNITLFIGFHTGNYQCKKCGYIGPIIIEEEKKKIRGKGKNG